MKYCQYHPLNPATYECHHCQSSQCDHCVDEGKDASNETCFICKNKVESLGAMYNAEPFWRRFQQSFQYPLRTETIIFIVGMALLGTIIPYLPFTLIWFLMLTGIFMKYCFSCLEKTANGSLTSPAITTAYEGGIILALKLIAILFIIGLSIFGVLLWLGTAMATFFGVIALCCCPAIIINFSLSESVLDAINPLKIIYLISAIGLPYGLLLAMIMVMLGSVGFINELIGHHFSMVSLAIQSAVTNYYTIVIFHLMGYMLFQYQGQLGFIARQEEEKKGRSSAERTLANIEVHVKEGLYDEALLLFQDGLKKHSKNKALHSKCLDFLLATKNKELIDDYAPLYFSFLVKHQAKDQLTLSYKKILAVYPKFMPASPEDRLLLAQECKASGDSLSVIRLLNGIHQQFPRFGRLIPALELLVDALHDLPNMTEKAQKFDLLVKRYKKQKEKERTKPKPRQPIKSDLVENISLEERIKTNAEINNPSTPPPETDDGIDYDGGIDFK